MAKSRRTKTNANGAAGEGEEEEEELVMETSEGEEEETNGGPSSPIEVDSGHETAEEPMQVRRSCNHAPNEMWKKIMKFTFIDLKSLLIR